MRIRRRCNVLVEPASAATGDIAFNLIVFFLVCVSTQPDRGFRLSVPSSEQSKETKKSENIELQLTRDAILLNGNLVPKAEFLPLMKSRLAGKTRPEDKVVVVKSRPDVQGDHWITVVRNIQQAGGTITLQVEEERQVQIP